MDHQLMKSLQDEQARLLRILEGDENYRRLRAVEALLRLYRPDKGLHVNVAPTQHYRSDEPMALASRRVTEATQQIREALLDILKNETSPVATRELLESLVARGVEVPGESPINNLSSILSRDDRFMNWGRRGWTLAGNVLTNEAQLREVARSFGRSLSTQELSEIANTSRSKGVLSKETTEALMKFATDDLGRRPTEEESNNLSKGLQLFAYLTSSRGPKS